MRLSGSTLEDGTLARVSPSQIKTWNTCNLKWWFQKVAKLPTKPPSAAMLLGTQAHARIEKFLLTGEDVRGPLELAGAHLLEPYLGRPLLVERAIDNPPLYTAGGVQITGFLDLLVEGAPRSELDSGVVIVDHKFKGDLLQYGITRTELLRDPQTVIYGAWAVRRFDIPRLKTVEIAHHEHQTRGARLAQRVVVTPTAEELLESFDSLCNVVDSEMSAAATQPQEEIRPNTTQCGAFGGCDFLEQCPHSPRNNNPLINATRSNAMGLVRRDTPAPVAAPVPATQPPDPVGPTQPPESPGLLAKLTPDRAAKAKKLGIDVDSALAPTPPAEEAPQAQAEAKAPKARRAKDAAPASDLGTTVLLVNCYTAGASDGAAYVAQAFSECCAARGEADIRVVPKDHVCAFGAWRAVFAEYVKANPPPAGVYLLTSGELSDVVVEALAITARVIRGLR